jgi:hypothetical protein
MIMTDRKRLQLVAALLLAPLVIAVPALWPHFEEPGFFRRNLDVLLIFVTGPYAAALWLYFRAPRRPRPSPLGTPIWRSVLSRIFGQPLKLRRDSLARAARRSV